MKHSVYTYNNLNDKLNNEWRSCWENSEYSHFYNSPDWFTICEKVFNYRDKKLIVLKKNNNIVAVLPLVKDYRYGVDSWCFPGKKFLNKSALLTTKLQNISSLLSDSNLPNNIFLDENPSEYIKLFKNLPSARIIFASTNPYLDIKDNPMRYLSNKQFSKIKNKVSKYSSEIKHIVTNGNIKSLITAFEIEKKSFKYSKGIAEFSNKTSREFFELLCKYEQLKIRFDFLIYKSQPVVHSIGILENSTYHALHTAYDKEYAHLIPGKQLLFYMLNDMRIKKIKRFDFSRGTNEIKHEFTPTKIKQYAIHLTTSPTTRWWWNTVDKLSKKLIDNKLFYPMYTQSKKIIKSL